MKTQSGLLQRGLMVSMLTASLLLSVGCAKKGDGFSAETAEPTPTTTTDRGPVTPDTDTPRGPEFANGATAAFTVESMAALTAYVGTHPVNNPTDMRISVKLSETATSSNMFYGDVMLSYQDNGQYYTGHFRTQNTNNPTGSSGMSAPTLYPGVNHAYYNNWLEWNGKYGFHGFFEDSYGAVLLVVDATVDQGDGGGATQLSGSIWFKNYANTQFQKNQHGIPCWFMTAAAYDCRTFLVPGGPTGDGNIDSGSALYPTDSQWWTSSSTHPYIPVEPARGWRKLGTFSDLNKAKAFSQ
jgi:hypothetical protein